MTRTEAELKKRVKKAVQSEAGPSNSQHSDATRVAKITNESLPPYRVYQRWLPHHPMNCLQLRRQGSHQRSHSSGKKHVNDLDLKLQIQRRMAHKTATTLYDAELTNPEGEKKLSAQKSVSWGMTSSEWRFTRENSNESWLQVERGYPHIKLDQKYFPTLTSQHLANAFGSL